MSKPDSSASKPDRLAEPHPGSPRVIDLEHYFPPNAKLSITPPEELAHAHRMEAMKEEHRQRIELETLRIRRSADLRAWWAAILATVGAVIAGIVLISLPTTDDLKKTVYGGLFSIFTAWMGYLGGQATRGPTKPSE